MRFAKLVALLLLVIAAACGQADRAEPAPSAAPAAVPKPVGPAVEAPVTDRVEDPTFELALTPNGSYEASKLSSFSVTLKPRGIYHINQDYPIALSIRPAAGLSFPKAELGRSDMAEMGEKVARFDVPFSADKAGAHRVEANLRFAVCTDENCVPDERALALELAVR